LPILYLCYTLISTFSQCLLRPLKRLDSAVLLTISTEELSWQASWMQSLLPCTATS
jgi:hypothetical protein